MELVHGGDWAGYRAEFGRDALDFFGQRQPAGAARGRGGGHHSGTAHGRSLPGPALPGTAH